MTAETAIDILKQAILLERRGKAFYGKVAESTGNEATRQFFESMADEEKKHIEALSLQYKNYLKEKNFVENNPGGRKTGEIAAKVLTKELKQKISASGFEAAAISAAIAMEERAIKLYSDRAAATSSPEEKALYQWLADWEKEHLRVLAGIDKALTEAIWFDNQFWPF